MLKFLPYSAWWFVATGVIYLLQLFPFTGIFLMLVAAPFWSVLTVNLGFLSLAGEALVRPGYRIWLLAPILYFGGYFAAAYVSHQQFTAWDDELRAANAGVSVSYAPDAHALVVRKGRNGRMSGLAGALVHTYGVPVAYEENPNFKTASHLSRRVIAGPMCRQIADDRSARAAHINVTWFHENRKLVKDMCRLQRPEDPGLPVIAFSAKQEKQSRTLLPATIDEITIELPDGTTKMLRSGSAAPLSWFPMPVMGCALNSGAPSWDCFAGFQREKSQGLAGSGGYGGAIIDVVAQALGLKKVSLDQLRGSAPTDITAGVEEAIERRNELSLKNLERIINDPSERLTVHDVRGLKEQPELWREGIAAMIDTLEQAMLGGDKTRERAGILQDLLGVLPDEQYRPVAERVLSILSVNPELSRDYVRDRTLERLSVLGARAMPVLEQRAVWSNRKPSSGYLKGTLRFRVSTGALIGICKIGPTGAGRLAETIARPFLSPEGRLGRDERLVAAVTLLRLGRRDLARRMDGERPDTILQQVLAKTQSGVSAEDCMTRSDWHSRLQRKR